jgi:hypothetical protein
MRRLKKSFIKRKIRYGKQLFNYVVKQPDSLQRRAYLRFMGCDVLRPCNLAGAAKCSFDLLPSSVATITHPGAVDEINAILPQNHPKIQVHLIEDATVSTYTGGIVSNGCLALPNNVLNGKHRVLLDDDSLFSFEASYSTFKKVELEHLQKAIFLGGAGAYNWYHFIIEILPKALLAQMLPTDYADYPLLVPVECRDIPSFAEALAVFTQDREVIYLPKGEYLRVKHLIAFDDVSTGPHNLKLGLWPKVDDYSQHDDFMRDYIGALRAAFLPADMSRRTKTKRIFLARPSVRRKYNQTDLVDIATKYGFEEHDPSGLTLSEQAALFASSEMIIGPSGAAWVGMIFREDPAQFLSWLPPEYAQFCSYSSMAAMLDHKMGFLETHQESVLNWTGDVYDGAYRLAPEPFERAVQHMTGPV